MECDPENGAESLGAPSNRCAPGKRRAHLNVKEALHATVGGTGSIVWDRYGDRGRFSPGKLNERRRPEDSEVLAAPTADTVFFQGQIDVVGGEGKVVRCKDDGTYCRCFEVKNAGRSN
jgi:hypothetical protein